MYVLRIPLRIAEGTKRNGCKWTVDKLRTSCVLGIDEGGSWFAQNNLSSAWSVLAGL